MADSDRSRQPDKPADDAPPRKRRRRRWPWVVLAVVLVLVLLVVLAPYLLSTGAGTRMIESIANDRIKGHIAIGDLSLNWLGPTNIRDVRLLDAQGRQVLSAASVRYDGGVMRAATSPMQFRSLVIEGADVKLLLDEQGRPSLLDALEPRAEKPQAEAKPKKPSQPSEPPKPVGKLTLRNATVTAVKPDGRSLQFGIPSAEVELDTLNDIAAELALLTPDTPAPLQVKLAARQLFPRGEMDFASASGALQVGPASDVNLAPLLSFFTDATAVAGRANIDVNAAFKQGAIDGSLAAGAKGLQVARGGEARVQQMDIAVSGKFKTGPERSTADLRITGPGDVTAALTYKPSDRPLDVSLDDVLNAVLRGSELSLPTFSLKANGSIDLAKVAAAVPALVRIRGGTEVASGQLQLRNFTASAEPNLTLGGGLGVTDLSAVRNGQPLRLEPISLTVAAAMEPQRGLNISQLNVQSGFATASISGLAGQKLTGQINADLAKARAFADDLLDVDIPQLAGRLSGTLSVTESSPQRLETTATLALTDFALTTTGGSVRAKGALVYESGYINLQDGKVAEIGVGTSKLEVDDYLLTTATGRYNPPSKSGKFEFALQRAQLAGLWKAMSGFDIDQLRRYGGSATGSKTLQIMPDGSMVANSQLVLADLTVDGKPLNTGNQPATLTVADAKLLPAGTGRKVSVETLKLASGILNVTAEKLQADLGRKASASGKVTIDGAIGPMLAAAQPVAGWQSPPRIDGKLTFNGSVATSAGVMALVGSASVPDLTAGSGERSVGPEPMELACDVGVDTNAKLVTVRKLDLASKPLAANIGGSISHYDTQRLLDLRVRYSGDWPKIVAIMHELAPKTAEVLAFAGQTSDQFTISGPANAPTATPVYRGVTAKPTVQWASADVYGLSLGKAALTPELKNGVVVLPSQTIEANGGKLTVVAQVDLTGKEPVLKIPGRTQMLQDVGLSSKFGKHVLARANPVLADMVEGKVGLLLVDIDVPLGEGLKTGGSGSGHLDLSNLKFKASGHSASLMQMLGLSTDVTHVVRTGKGMDFQIRAGRIHYRDFELIFAESITVAFSGSVSFDGDLDLRVAMPLKAPLLEKLGLKPEYANILGDVRIEVPMVGSRDLPTLDLRAVDPRPILEQATKRLLQGGSDLRGIIPGLGPREQAPKEDGATTAPTGTRKPLLPFLP